MSSLVGYGLGKMCLLMLRKNLMLEAQQLWKLHSKQGQYDQTQKRQDPADSETSSLAHLHVS